MGGAALTEQQRRALDRLSREPLIEEFYLAGGSAIAAHLGHRVSRDLDLFSMHANADLDATKQAADRCFDSVEVVQQSDASLHLLCDGLPIDFVRYPYPPLAPPGDVALGVRVAGLPDLGVMKLSAIARRGLRRDFWDLAAILDSGIDLCELGDAYRRRFGVKESDLYHVARALTYFDDAEKDPVLPPGMTDLNWEHIMTRMRVVAPALVRA